jgi:hypothetical protein
MEQMVYKGIRVSNAILVHVEGSGLFVGFPGSRAEPGWYDARDPESEAIAASLAEKLEAAPNRKDRSCIVELSKPELELLLEYVDHLRAASRDDSGWSAEARGDYNSARAFLRKYRPS